MATSSQDTKKPVIEKLDDDKLAYTLGGFSIATTIGIQALYEDARSGRLRTYHFGKGKKRLVLKEDGIKYLRSLDRVLPEGSDYGDIEITENTLIRDYKRSVEWRKEEGRALFKTDSALEWFVRRHRPELVKTGAMILRGGPGGSLVKVALIDKVILEILSRESEEILAGKAAA